MLPNFIYHDPKKTKWDLLCCMVRSPDSRCMRGKCATLRVTASHHVRPVGAEVEPDMGAALGGGGCEAIGQLQSDLWPRLGSTLLATAP